MIIPYGDPHLSKLNISNFKDAIYASTFTNASHSSNNISNDTLNIVFGVSPPMKMWHTRIKRSNVELCKKERLTIFDVISMWVDGAWSQTTPKKESGHTTQERILHKG